MHPFLEGVAPLAQSLGGSVVEPHELSDGDIPLHWDGELVGGFRPAGLQGALERIIERVEQEMGCALCDLDRAGKQGAVRRLDELGAFTLRKAVEDIADQLQVSRFTVYNYLNAHSLPTQPPPGDGGTHA